jgi:transposase
MDWRSMDDRVGADNEVRVIDAFVDTLPMAEMGFEVMEDDIEDDGGRPAYHPSDLLKLYLYGYLNRCRSSRELEKLCAVHIDVIWLMKGLTPDHNTIARFRKDNPDAIRKVFEATVNIAKHHNLIGGRLLAGDGTKLRAQNSKKNNYNPRKIERHLEMIETKLNQYNKDLALADGDKEQERQKIQDIKKAIRKQRQHKQKYEDLKKRMEQTGEEQISTSDPDSKHMIIRGQVTEVAYNIQSTVDAENNLPIDYKVTNSNDSKAMGEMVERATNILGHNDFTALYDKGYHTGSEFEKAHELGVNVMVAIPDSSSHAPDSDFDVRHFIYNPKKDQYTCPARKILRTNGRWYTKDRGKSRTMVKHYKTEACQGCTLKNLCTKNAEGRLIERPQNAHLVAANRERIEADPMLYKRRQAIVEHPFGTIKRAWGFDHIMTKKSIKHANADVGLIFTAYNIRRLLSILSPNQLKVYLERVVGAAFVKTTRLDHFKPILRYLNFTRPHVYIFSHLRLNGSW